jgi:hypothetical protein
MSQASPDPAVCGIWSGVFIVQGVQVVGCVCMCVYVVNGGTKDGVDNTNTTPRIKKKERKRKHKRMK